MNAAFHWQSNSPKTRFYQSHRLHGKRQYLAHLIFSFNPSVYLLSDDDVDLGLQVPLLVFLESKKMTPAEINCHQQIRSMVGNSGLSFLYEIQSSSLWLRLFNSKALSRALCQLIFDFLQTYPVRLKGSKGLLCGPPISPQIVAQVLNNGMK